MDISLEQLKQLLPQNVEKELAEWQSLLNPILNEYEINTPSRVAAFISQTGHESEDYTVLSENLNYGATGLTATFGKYFPGTTSAAYARLPAKIANRVYASRMGNGDEASGDGWKFRGRGILQVTGKDNYHECSQFIFGNDTLIENPDLLLQKQYALRSACWFWTKNKLNAIADKADVTALTKRVNGGTNGLADRKERFTKALAILAK